MTDPLARLSAALADRYLVERELGAGGMATVYLALDERHGRRVAIKVLQPELAAMIGAERFLVEIRTTASLQHPHILGLIDSGSVDGIPYYVMPFVEGESLRDRLDRERQLPVEDALRIAREVADALAHAHGQGIVHRDIKPDNILLQGGHALVADFGIALAVSTAGGARMTQTGLSLGTPSYMSPEQASGERGIDARSDLYSLGAVLHEMLAGEPPFTGPSVQAVVAQVLAIAPQPLRELRPTVPAPIEAAVLKALQKLPADRFSTASEFIAALAVRASGMHAMPSVHAPTERPGAVIRRFAPWVVAVAALAFALVPRGERAPPQVTERWHLVLPDSAPIDGRVLNAPAAPTLSHDGTLLAYSAARDTTRLIYLARLGTAEVTPVPGTGGGYLPFFSPDDQWLGFIANRQLKRIELATGRVVVVHDGIDAWGAAWTEAGDIAVINQTGILRWAGGTGAPLRVRIDIEGTTQSLITSFLSAIPGSNRVLTTDADWRVVVVSLDDGAVRYLTDGTPTETVPLDGSALIGVWPRFVRPGYLVFWRPGAILLAVRFDPRTLAIDGPPVEMRRGVRVFHAGVSESGTWAYVPELARGNAYIADRAPNGAMQRFALPVRRYQAIASSPDGRRLAVRLMTESGASAVETGPVTDGRMAPIERIAAGDGGTPVWAPDGRFLFADSTGGIVYRLDVVDGVLDSLRIPTEPGERAELVDVLDRDTMLAVIGRGDEKRLFVVPWRDPSARTAVATGRPIVLTAQLSPSRRLLAYTAIANDVPEFVVEAWPPDGRRMRVTVETAPQFAWDARDRLLYQLDGAIVRSAVAAATDGITVGEPVRIMETGGLAQDAWQTFAPLPADGGMRLLMSGAPTLGRYFTVVRGWERELERALTPP